MKGLLTLGAALSASLALAACGGAGNGSPDTAAHSGGGTTVAVKSVGGVGRVLVDAEGKALYSSDQEATGKLLCTSAACTSFWKPLTTDSAMPTATAGAGKVGVVKRPDGSMQVAVDGRPLYTFAEDQPGKVTGDGFSDDLGGRHFTWHAVRAGGATSSGGSGGASGSSQGSGGGSPGTGYGY
jgi:predicted lipoprotein with Yx(FWY)xxD motif